MTSDRGLLFPFTFNDEKVGKTFFVSSSETRICNTCGQSFSRQAAFEHSKVTCYPWSQSC